MNRPIRILVVDDHEVMRRGLRQMLETEEDTEVIGECASGEEALSEAAKLQPDVVLIDAIMPGIDGIETTRALKRTTLDYSGDVIILAESADYQTQAIEAGATSFLLKNVTHAELTRVIREVYRNRQSLAGSGALGEEAIEVVVPAPVNAARLLRFICQLEGALQGDFASIVCTVGSWDCGTLLTIRSQPATTRSVLTRLASMPEVEKAVEEAPTVSGLGSFTRRVRFLPRPEIPASKRVRITLREMNLASSVN